MEKNLFHCSPEADRDCVDTVVEMHHDQGDN